jgi:ABC-type transport system involved in multi-copper enzyme maturation permease subunit
MSEAASGALDHTGLEELSSLRLTFRQVRALVLYTIRESVHRWTLITYLLGITFFLLLLATAVNLDIVEGTLASARLFGQDLQIGEFNIQVEDAVRYFQVGLISTLYVVGVLLALFLTSNYVPALAREGWVDLLVAQPVSRSTLLLGRALGSVTVVGIGIAYLVVGSWFVLRLKTGIGGMGLLFAGLVILFTYAVCYSATVLIGIITRNGPVSGMAGFMVWLGALPMHGFHANPEWRVVLRAGWPRQTATAISEGLYWILPKSWGLRTLAVDAARGEPVSLLPIAYSLPFALVCLFLACWWFTQRDY